MTMTGKTRAQVNAENTAKQLEREKAQLKKVLEDTQQYVLDRAEFGTEIPEAIRQQRQVARIRLAEIG